MYPSKGKPHFGIFVKNTYEILNSNKNAKVKLIKPSSVDNKLKKYFHLYKEIWHSLKYNWDLVYINYLTHSSIPVLLRNFPKKKHKILVHIHGGDLLPQNIMGKYLLKFHFLFKNLIDYYIVPSKYFFQILENRYSIDRSKIFIFPSGGVDTDKFKPMNKEYCKRSLGIPIDYFVMGFVSRLDKNKGWDVFLESVNYLKLQGHKIKAIVVGEGKEKNNFLKKVRDIGLQDHIIYLGKKSHDELPYIYNAMDLFVFSTKLHESLGLVGLEAMACSVPVIGSNIGGLTDYIVDNYNGYLFEPGNSKQLVEKIKAFISMPEEKKEKLRKNALYKSQEFSAKILRKKLKNFIREISDENIRNS